MTTPESARHDYEPGQPNETSVAETDPPCRICGAPKRSAVHR